MKKFIGIFLGIIICLSLITLVACDVKPTELPVPVISKNSFDSTTNTISWSSVSNCDGYTIKIDNTEYNTTALSYTVSFNESKDFTFSIKARGKGLNTSDSLWSETFTWHYTYEESISNDGKLATPILINYNQNTIYWERVDNASGYEIEFNQSFIKATALNSYQVSEEDFSDSCSFSFRLRAVSSDINILPSNWSEYTIKTYSKTGDTVNTDWTHIFMSNGIGQTVNAINDRYIEPASGTESIFNESDLFKLRLTEYNISLQKAELISENSMLEASNKWSTSVDVKVYKGNDGTGKTNTKNFGKGLGYKFEVAAGLDIERSDKTTELYYSLSQIVAATRVEIAGYKNTDKLTNILSDQFKNDATLVQSGQKTPEWLINKYGTHLITAGYFGGRIDATYSFVSNDTDYSRDIAAQIGVEITNKLTYIVNRGTSVDVVVNNNYRQNSSLTKAEFLVECLGGMPKSFGSIEDFGNNYSEWANSLSENKTLIDVPNESLIFIWDLLPDEFNALKIQMYNYYCKQNENEYANFLNKFSKSFSSTDNYQDGTEEHPYLISNPKELYQRLSNSKTDEFYKLVDDINLLGIDWQTIRVFNGSLDGNNHVISNLTIKSVDKENNNSFYGAFIRNNNGVIKNIAFDNLNINVDAKYDSSKETRLRSGIIGINNGTISNIKLENSVFDVKLNEEKSKSGHDVKLILDLGAIAACNNGTVEYVVVKNSSLKAYSNGRSNKGEAYCVVGGVVGTNKSNISNCIVSNLNLSSEARCGYYVFLKGGGWVKSWVGYIVGNNEGIITNGVSYNQADNSMYSYANTLAKYMGKENCCGLIAGKSSGQFDKVFAVKNNTLSTFIGNDANANKENVRTTVNEIYSIVIVWENWNFVDSEFVFEIV